MTYLVVDLSFSDITEEWVRTQVARGVKVIFVAAWTGGYAMNARLRGRTERNLWAIHRGGAIPAIYSNATPYYRAITSYRETLANCGTAYALVKHVMVDIEIAENGNPILPEEVHALAMLFKTDGKNVCTYSADWYVGWWKLQLGDANRVQLGYPYVHARYDHVADIAVNPPRHPIGPVIGKQYEGSHDQNGIQIDSDIIYASFFQEVNAMQIDEILTTPEQRAAFARFFTPIQWMDYDRATNSPKHVLNADGKPIDNGIPWFGRSGIAPSDMLAVCQGYADSIHLGSILAALGVVAPSDTGNIREQVAKLGPVDASTLSDEVLAAEVLRRLKG